MYAQQSSIDPSLAALLQTAQMVTPDQTPTVAAQVAQAAQQKMQPQGIMQGMQGPQGMQGAKQDYAAAAPSMMRNMQQAQVQQMMQQAMQPQPAGIEGLPAQNMQGMQRMAVGGVVGYSGKEESYVDPQFPSVYENYVEPTREARTGREEDELFGPMKSERQRVIEAVAEELLGPMTKERLAAAPQRQTQQRNKATPTPRPPAERPPAPAPRPSAQPGAAPDVTGIAALPATPTLDKSGVATAGDAIAKAAADREARMRGILTEREKMAAGMADLSAEGIAALQEANRARQELLGKQRGDDKFNRQIALLRGFQGDRAAYDRAVAGQQARDEAANQAQLMHQQAVLKLREAQQAKQLGQFDRALAFEQQAADLEGKARASALEAQRISASLATSEYTGRVNLREQDIRMQEGAQNRANAMELERMRRATADRPGETERIFNRFNELKAKDPAAAEQYLQNIERIKGLGKGVTERQDVNELKALIASLRDQADPMKNMDKASREQASVLLRQAQEKLAQMSGLGGASNAPAQLPPAALSQLKAGVVTTFANGQQWTLENGQPKQVK